LHVDPKWDYERSPIFFIKNAGEMSWKNKERSIQGNTKIVEKIISHHKDENGLIHTVNYEVMNYLKNNLKNKRLLFYNNSKEKELVLQKFYESGGILVGPSHFEGLNFNLSIFVTCFLIHKSNTQTKQISYLFYRVEIILAEINRVFQNNSLNNIFRVLRVF
jgi:hypothetical protein